MQFDFLQVMNEDGHTSSIRDKILTITVKKGWKPGTKITFPKEGDQGPNNVPGQFAQRHEANLSKIKRYNWRACIALFTQESLPVSFCRRPL